MGISQIGVPNSTISPSSASRPIFTLANTYNLSSSLSGVNFTANVVSDMVYDKGLQRLAFVVTDSTASNALATWTLGTTTVNRFSLPISAQSANYKLLSGRSNRLWFAPGLYSSSYGLYSSTGGASSTWENPFGSTSRSDLACVGSNHNVNTNPNDVVDFLELRNYALGANYISNYTSQTAYQIFISGGLTPSDASGGSNPRQKITEIRSGDESDIINGYSYHAGSDLIDNANDGTRGVISHRLYDFRGTSYMYFITSEPPQMSTYNRDGWTKGVAGRETCIENRWILNIGHPGGDSMYDLSTGRFVGVSSLIGNGGSRVVYLSTTKKAYQYNRNNYKMYEYDVTFI
jgi:hypothetical protein